MKLFHLLLNDIWLPGSLYLCSYDVCMFVNIVLPVKKVTGMALALFTLH